MQVRVVQQILSPGVEDGQEAETSAEVARRSRDLQERLTGRTKEQTINHARILKCERCEQIGKRENDVRITHGQ
jgi:hypothetical protein